MKIVALDDEKLALSVLEKSISAAIPDAEISAFSEPAAALSHIAEKGADAVFCDYNMPGMDGITFAKKVKLCRPETNIVFVTGYDEYAPAAINAVCPRGYIMKPVSAKKIADVLGNLHIDSEKSGLYVQTFGMFNVLYDGFPVNFKVKKAEELLAYLVNNGGKCTRRELTAVLYEDKEEQNAIRYFKDAVRCLADTLAEYGLSDVLLHGFNSYAIDRSRLQCDLYEYLEGNVNLFRGEYMTQYEWAEFRIPQLLS